MVFEAYALYICSRLIYCRHDTIKEYDNGPVHELRAIVEKIPWDIEQFFELV